MDETRERASQEEPFPIKEAEAIKQCLTYLEIEAGRIGLGLTAHMIGVAAETIVQVIARTDPRSGMNGVNGTGPYEPEAYQPRTVAGARRIPVTVDGDKE